VVERGRGLRLTPEAGEEGLVAGQVRPQHLDRHRAVEPCIDPDVDLGHPAAADEFADLVSPAQ